MPFDLFIPLHLNEWNEREKNARKQTGKSKRNIEEQYKEAEGNSARKHPKN